MSESSDAVVNVGRLQNDLDFFEKLETARTAEFCGEACVNKENSVCKIPSHRNWWRHRFSRPVLGWLNHREPIGHQVSLWDFCDQYHGLPDHWIFTGFPGKARRAECRVEVLIPIGFIGAYSTFSTFEWETFSSLQTGAFFVAALYVVLSLFLGLVAVWCGVVIARLFS